MNAEKMKKPGMPRERMLVAMQLLGLRESINHHSWIMRHSKKDRNYDRALVAESIRDGMRSAARSLVYVLDRLEFKWVIRQ